MQSKIQMFAKVASNRKLKRKSKDINTSNKNANVDSNDICETCSFSPSTAASPYPTHLPSTFTGPGRSVLQTATNITSLETPVTVILRLGLVSSGLRLLPLSTLVSSGTNTGTPTVLTTLLSSTTTGQAVLATPVYRSVDTNATTEKPINRFFSVRKAVPVIGVLVGVSIAFLIFGFIIIATVRSRKRKKEQEIADMMAPSNLSELYMEAESDFRRLSSTWTTPSQGIYGDHFQHGYGQ